MAYVTIPKDLSRIQSKVLFLSLIHICIEEIKAGLETTEKGGVRQSIRNCLTVFQRDPLLSGAIAYNVMTDRKDIIKPIGFHREGTALNDTDMKYLLLYLEENYGLTNEKKIDNAIGIVANENKYHPIRDLSLIHI